MSLLLKALNQAAADREAARLAAGEKPGDEMPPLPAHARSADPGGRAASASAIATPAYGGLWVVLALAVVSAAGFGYWMRGSSPVRPPMAPAEGVQASAPGLPATGTIPATLQAHEAGPLQLQLDRHLETPDTRTR